MTGRVRLIAVTMVWVCSARAAAPTAMSPAAWMNGSIPDIAAVVVGKVAAAASPETAPAHATITEYLGPETCIACHRNAAEAMHGSVHYQQTGPTPNVPNIPGYAGERGFGDIGFNTYCGTHVSSSRATCAACHVGNGRFPSPELSDDQLHNIDCLMCHQDQYRRKPAGPFRTVPVVGQDGMPATIQVPVEDASGFQYEPDVANMVVSVVTAAQTVHLPTRASCLRCHAGASGSDGGKRGDISSVTVNPPRSSDVHMSAAGGNLTCADCHAAGGHRVRGRGLDLRPNDTPERFTCAACHTNTPHGVDDREVNRLNLHATRVACQTCHIPTFAKDISTEMERDWNNPFFSPAACSGQGGWKPEEIRESNVIPTYAWFDGTSEVYVLGQVPPLNADGEYAMGVPLGSVASDGAKIYPMKEHRSTSGRLAAIAADLDGDGDVDARDYEAVCACLAGPVATAPVGCETADVDGDADVDLTDYQIVQLCVAGGCGLVGELIPHSTYTFFTTGDFSQAVEAGMAYAGMRGTWEQVPVHTFQTINHGVEDHDYALKCGACHPSLSGGPVRMDLQSDLGYAVKWPAEQVCFQCHGAKEPKPFLEIHNKHVDDRQFDCAWCHSFSRPERGLTLPPINHR